MKPSLLFYLVVFIIPTLVDASDEKETISEVNVVYSGPGRFLSPSGLCAAEQNISSMGGFNGILVRDRNGKIIMKGRKDSSGLAWVSGDTLVFSVSPVYGKPGIFQFSCVTKEIREIVEPRNKDQYYPDGADFFELYRIENEKILFYYSMDVDKTDFSKFRVEENIFKVKMDGTGFGKAF